MYNDAVARGLAKKKEMEEEKKKKQSQTGFFAKLRGLFSGDNDPSKRGATRTSPELLKKEEEARKKREEERKRRGY